MNKAVRSSLVLLLLLVLPATAMALTIGDIDLGRVDMRTDMVDKIDSGNIITFFIKYPDPNIRIVQVITEDIGYNYFRIDIVKYFKGDEYFVWIGNESHNPPRVYTRKIDPIDKDMMKGIFDEYLGKLSIGKGQGNEKVVRYPTGGGNRYPDIDKQSNPPEPDVAVKSAGWYPKAEPLCPCGCGIKLGACGCPRDMKSI